MSPPTSSRAAHMRLPSEELRWFEDFVNVMGDEEYNDWTTFYERREEVEPDLENLAFGQTSSGDQLYPEREKLYTDGEIDELDKIRKNGIPVAARNEDEDDVVSGQVGYM